MKKRLLAMGGALAALSLIILSGGIHAAAEEKTQCIVDFEGSTVTDLAFSDKLADGRASISWQYTAPADTLHSPACITVTGYEVSISTDADFAADKTAVYTVDNVEGQNAYSYDFAVADLKATGGYYYTQIRTIAKVNGVETPIYSANLSEPAKAAYVKICDDNFKGLTALLKKGVGADKNKYDDNGDGWLCPFEISRTTIVTNNKVVVKKGKTTYDYSGKIQAKVKGFAGLYYFVNLEEVAIREFSGGRANLIKATAKRVEFTDVHSTVLKLEAPNAKEIFVEGDMFVNKPSFKKLDLSKCKSANKIDARGAFIKYIDLKLPSSGKNLRSLSVQNIKGSTMNINKYVNLLEFNMYSCQASKVQADKCKELRYAFFQFSTSLSKVDLSKCSKLTGVGVQTCGRLTCSSVKTRKGCKKKDNVGRWWLGTKEYKKNVEDKIFD